MIYLSIENLTKTFNDRVILNKISISINEGEKVALIAKNGTGKSTLLKIIAGKEKYDEGLINFRQGIKIRFLEQDPDLNLNSTINEEIFSSDSPIIKAVKLYEESLSDPEDMNKMQIAYDEMNKHNAWEYESKIKGILENLNLHKLDTKIEKFSGGQKKRVALAKILIDNPDFLIMDEPTNHLDLEMIEWLENYLKEEKITLLMVTHDRYFLERVCNEIIELEDGNVYTYKGNYSYFLDKKASRELNENINIDKTRSLLRKELEWVRKGPRGRQAKSTARVDAYNELKSGLKEKKVIDKVKLDIVGKYMGGKILEIHNLTKSFGDKKILNKFNYSFNKGEKLGIIGKNGVGKTTFLNLIMGLEEADSGKIVTGETVNFGYYSQSGFEFEENVKIIDSIKKIALYIKLSDGTEVSASKMLERFLFTPPSQQNLISKLSGGERKRLNLLRILMQNPNFLILDEPTNDFDIMTLNVLEEFLTEFKGCIIIISHDRYFMDKIVDHLLVFEGNGEVRDFTGNYSEYRDRLAEEELENKGAKVKTNINLNNSNKKVEEESNDTTLKTKGAKNNKEANEMYKQIAKLEKKKESIMNLLGDTKLSIEQIKKYSSDVKELTKEIEELTENWLELSA